MTKYLIRLDDACPTMHSLNWQKIEDILDRYSIKPMVGIVPNNEDPNLLIDQFDSLFWEKAHRWKNKGWAIALHGYNHVYCSSLGGLNPVHKRSEFAGVPKEIQREKIKKGYLYLNSKGLYPKYFFAPSHTFDIDTVDILLNETDIRTISDTIALKPYKAFGINFIPQQFGQFRKLYIPGIYTFCFHPNEMNENDFLFFESFISENSEKFIVFDDVNDFKVKSIWDTVFSFLYFLYRRI